MERPNFSLVSSFLTDSEDEEDLVNNVVKQAKKKDIEATKKCRNQKEDGVLGHQAEGGGEEIRILLRLTPGHVSHDIECRTYKFHSFNEKAGWNRLRNISCSYQGGDIAIESHVEVLRIAGSLIVRPVTSPHANLYFLLKFPCL